MYQQRPFPYPSYAPFAPAQGPVSYATQRYPTAYAPPQQPFRPANYPVASAYPQYAAPYNQSRIVYGQPFAPNYPQYAQYPQFSPYPQPQMFTSRVSFPQVPQQLASPTRQLASPVKTAPLVNQLYSPPRGSRPQPQPLAKQPATNNKKTSQPKQQTQPKPQPKVQAPPAKKPQSQPQPEQPAPAAKEDDLEKRFADAIKRTKDIVEKYHPPAEEAPQNDDPQIEELALQYEDGYIYRGQGIPPQTRQGFGVLNDQDNNEVYAGFWHDNFYHGEGRLNNLQQEAIDGPIDWKDMTGIGNGWAGYEGEFNQGKMHGNGILFLTNGEKFQGQFQDGMVNGEGEFHLSDGSTVKGIWDQGALVQLVD